MSETASGNPGKLTISALMLVLFATAAANVSLSKSVVKTAGDIKVTMTVDKTHKLKSWFVKSAGLDFELSQRLPDQNRALFMARGYDEKSSDFIAKRCVYKTVLKSVFTAASKKIIKINLNKWEVWHKGKKRQMLTREKWVRLLKPFKISHSKMLVVVWGFYPTQNVLMPGDYNWGLTGYGLAPGEKFDLVMNWTVNGKPRQVRIKNVECTPDKRRL